MIYYRMSLNVHRAEATVFPAHAGSEMRRSPEGAKPVLTGSKEKCNA